MRLADAVARLRPLAPLGDDGLVERQLRYWSREGFLGEDLQARSGAHRRYDDEHLFKAALFLELSQYGLGARLFRGAAEWLPTRISEYRRKWGADPFVDARRGIEVLVIFSPLKARSGGSTAWLQVERGHQTVIIPGAPSWIVVQLSMLLAAL